MSIIAKVQFKESMKDLEEDLSFFAELYHSLSRRFSLFLDLQKPVTETFFCSCFPQDVYDTLFFVVDLHAVCHLGQLSPSNYRER